MTTSDCKKFLVNKFPETKSTMWKRVTKYKNADGLYVRVFQYNDDKMIGLVENGDTLSIVKDDDTLERKNSASINYHVTEEDRNEFSNGLYRNANSSGQDSRQTTESQVNDLRNWCNDFNIPVRYSDEQESLTGTFDPRANKFIFSVMAEGASMMDSVFVAIVEYDYWIAQGSMNDSASAEPAEYMPPEWCAEDTNDGGSWLIYTNLTPLQVEAKLKSIGFMWTKQFDDYIKNG